MRKRRPFRRGSPFFLQSIPVYFTVVLHVYGTQPMKCAVSPPDLELGPLEPPLARKASIGQLVRVVGKRSKEQRPGDPSWMVR